MKQFKDVVKRLIKSKLRGNVGIYIMDVRGMTEEQKTSLLTAKERESLVGDIFITSRERGV